MINKIGYLLYRLWQRIKEIPYLFRDVHWNRCDEREYEWYLQRKTRGFDDTQLWGLYDSIARFILPRLRQFKGCHAGWPASLTEKKWEKVLDDMIKFFEFVVSDDTWHTPGTPEAIEYERCRKAFVKHFFSLWS